MQKYLYSNVNIKVMQWNIVPALYDLNSVKARKKGKPVAKWRKVVVYHSIGCAGKSTSNLVLLPMQA